MKNIIKKILNKIMCIFKIDDNKIIFESGRNKVDDNPLAIYEYMKKNNLDKKYKLFYLITKNTNAEMLDKKDICYYRTLRGMFHKATAKYFIKSQSTGGIIDKRKEQICIHADHGMIGLKKIGYDVENTKSRPPLPFTKDWDYFISSSPYNTKTFKNASGYNGTYLDLGLARTDKLVNIDEERIKKIKTDLGLLNNKEEVVLYAPTFRDNKEYSLKHQINKLSKVKNKKIIITCHPLAKEDFEKYELDKNFINAINYEINDLLLVSDILITDYSSVIFDYLILDKPIIFYPYDYDNYLNERSGFYLDYKKDLPGNIVYSIEDLIKVLNSNRLIHKYDDKRREFAKKYICMCDGNVCKRIVDMLENNGFRKDKHE